MSRNKKLLAIIVVVIVVLVGIPAAILLTRGPAQGTTTSSPTAVATPSASSIPTPSATMSPSASTKPTATPTTANPKPSAAPTPSATPTLDTSSWPKPIDCSKGTPPPEHLAYCKVAGKTQLQVVQACRTAALGTLWQDSPGHTFGTKDPNLKANIETCARGSGVQKNDETSYVMGWPQKGKATGKLQYVMVQGWDTSVDDTYQHVFNATGKGSDIGFIAFDESDLIKDISGLYDDFGMAE